MRYDVHIRQGERGKWRWVCTDEAGKCVAVCPVQGYESATQARESARALFNNWDAVVKVGLAE